MHDVMVLRGPVGFTVLWRFRSEVCPCDQPRLRRAASDFLGPRRRRVLLPQRSDLLPLAQLGPSSPQLACQSSLTSHPPPCGLSERY